ncbi:hypothetical protein E2C01_026892 [Portunus trituberculatus]|uniref:Uncharacterized protein n=1 Tax=Portunus trituberculatus TaxID=210409 RepID=A0A5B7EJM8_PORTR|nr:hypothetical protein [Portunus trituberculatus]
MTYSPHWPWCPTQPDTLEHLLLHCPCHHSHCVALLRSPTTQAYTDRPGRLHQSQFGLQDPKPHQDLLTQDKSAPPHII